ncbi:MAG: PaaI family thioesterase [Rhizobiaceae bacterium]
MSTIHPAQLLFTDKHPLTAELDMSFLPVKGNTLEVTLKAPKSFMDRDGIHVHSGFNTLLLDTVMGSCAIGELKSPTPIATIKLTCNHIRKIRIGEQISCLATWDGEEHSVAYVRGEIRFGDDQKMASHAIGTFMIGTTGKPLGSDK